MIIKWNLNRKCENELESDSKREREIDLVRGWGREKKRDRESEKKVRWS